MIVFVCCCFLIIFQVKKKVQVYSGKIVHLKNMGFIEILGLSP